MNIQEFARDYELSEIDVEEYIDIINEYDYLLARFGQQFIQDLQEIDDRRFEFMVLSEIQNAWEESYELHKDKDMCNLRYSFSMMIDGFNKDGFISDWQVENLNLKEDNLTVEYV